MIFRPLLSSLALLLTGCAASVAEHSAYPSLARRPVETRDYETPVVAPAAPTSATAVPDADLARYAAQAVSGAGAFDREYPAAERQARAAAGAAVSSDPWIAAQTAISGLEASRNDSVSALAALDTLYTERSNAIADGTISGTLDAIDAARAQALATVDSQNDRLDALKAMLAQP
ncbi:MAG: hypothetical protein ACSLE1_04625 [Sphingobium sp.]